VGANITMARRGRNLSRGRPARRPEPRRLEPRRLEPRRLEPRRLENGNA
jgi:hypothetical protein